MRDVAAVALGSWSRLALGVAALIGVLGFAWPFVVTADSSISDGLVPPLMFGVLLLLVLAVLLAQIADGGISAKALALLGVLSAVGAGLRPMGAGTAGIETVFFLLVLAGRVLGPGFGFVLGSTTLLSSALLTGGVGPWLPYQMFGASFVGLAAGLLPRARGVRELLLLGGYGVLAGYLYGFLQNLSTWPFVLGADTSSSFVKGASIGSNLHGYGVYYGLTSLGWDTGRAITNVVLIGVTGPAVLAALRRAARKAAFAAPVLFTPYDDVRPAPQAELTAPTPPTEKLTEHGNDRNVATDLDAHGARQPGE